MVLTVSFVISPVIGLSCHRHRQVTTCQLDTSVEASGPHDFAVRISTVRQPCYQRPPHPVPNVRDDRETPLSWDGMARVVELIWVVGEAEYFSKQGWTAKRLICPSGKISEHRIVTGSTFAKAPSGERHYALKEHPPV